MGVRLRPSAPADLAFAHALERAPENRDHIGQWSEQEHLDAIAGRDGREHWIVERDGAPSGFLIAYDERHLAGGIYIKRVLVADKERGTGTAALELFLDNAAARPGTEVVWLQVRERNVRAQALYAKLGMRRHDPADQDAPTLAGKEQPREGVFRMWIAASEWRRSRAR